MIDTLIFDFDGLVLDTESPDFQAWQEEYHRFGCELSLQDWISAVGGSPELFDPYTDLEAKLGCAIDRQSLDSRRERRLRQLIRMQRALPGVLDYLEDARRLAMQVALASSSPRAWITGNLRQLGIQTRFACIKCREDVSRVKPDPELYLAVLETLQVLPERAIALEDSLNGIRAAKRAGIFCVAIPNPITRYLDLHEANLVLESLADVPLETLARIALGNLNVR